MAPTANQFGIKPDEVRIVMQVAWRQVVDVWLLEHAPEKVDSLVERVQSVDWV